MKLLRNWLEILTGTGLAVVAIATFLQVLFRFALKIPAPWTEEVTRIAFTYMAFLGTALGVKYHSHLSVDVINYIPRGIRKHIISLGYIFSIFFVAIFAYFGWVHSMNSRMQFTPTLEISLLYMYIVMPISGLIMLYYLFTSFVKHLKEKQTGGSEQCCG